ncbi:MAG: MotA/TolQ/ExbB proton channel family protein, partial [Prevotellaceae bacterium]|nr:MotA/TolQ/ExbB proton channel family protein [Prevotellaceae bacterium]
DISLLSGGIYTALVTTVAGLIVGITAYFGYNYLSARIGSIMHIMERNIIDFIEMIRETSQKK